MEKIREGEAVRLKSGSPSMTVSKVFDKNDVAMATCVWTDKAGKPQREDYPLVVLEIDDGTLTF